MSNCFYCRRTLGINEPYYLIRTKDARFRGRKRYQTVAYCCEECEEEGAQCQFSTDEWRKIRDGRITCKTHPSAPHGFDRTSSHAEDRYVCECEHWEPEKEPRP